MEGCKLFAKNILLLTICTKYVVFVDRSYGKTKNRTLLSDPCLSTVNIFNLQSIGSASCEQILCYLPQKKDLPSASH